jgi:hypothetical protein
LTHIIARSISRPIHSALRQGPFAARVLAAFDHACDLVTPTGDVIALVAPQIGDGPLNIVVEGKPEDFASLQRGTAARLQEANLQIGDVQINLAGATVWEPRPDWNVLRAQRASIERNLGTLSSIGVRLAAPGSWLAGQDGILPYAQPVVQAALESLRTGWQGDLAQLQDGAARLAGLGNGLTPAGDDFLAGVMLRAWLAHPAPQSFCGAIVEAAAPRTTTLSAAFMRAAAQGECDAAWHQLLAAMGTATDDELARAVQAVLAHGATSGADTLAGFLWMASAACGWVPFSGKS